MSNSLADTCTAINNANASQCRQVRVRNINATTIGFLQTMQKHGYIDDITHVNDHRVNKVIVSLNGRLNRCGAICPTYSVKANEIERYRQSVLPARQFGHLIVSTSAGMMSHVECVGMGVGGKLLGYFY